MKYIYLFLLLFSSCKVVSQEKCRFDIDTMYYICIYYSNTPQKQPQMGYCFVKDILKYKISLNNYDEMVNSFYHNSFFSIEWNGEFYEVLNICYEDSTQKVREELEDNFYEKTIEIPEKYKFNSGEISLPDSTFVIITVYKMIAEFGKFPISEKSFSTVDLHYDFKSYQYDYFYRLRRIINFCTFNEEEKIAIRRIWR